jgi:hypothetical protein
MATWHNGGWDFVEVGKRYQYKESDLIGEIQILEDNSTDDEYSFKAKFVKAVWDFGDTPFCISASKSLNAYYNGMVNIYEHEEYYIPNGYRYIYE